MSSDRSSRGRGKQGNPDRKPSCLWISILLIVFLLLAAMLFQRVRSRRIRGRQPELLSRKRGPSKGFGLVPSQLQGLSEEEVQKRRLAREDDAESRVSRSNQDIWRENLFSIINLDLYALTVILLLIGRPREALLSAAGAAVIGAVVRRGDPYGWPQPSSSTITSPTQPATSVSQQTRRTSPENSPTCP